MDKLHTCVVCNIKNDQVVDSLCDCCEPLFMIQISKLSKTLPADTPLQELFAKATTEAIRIYQHNASVTHSNTM